MYKIRITLSNVGGELDRQVIEFSEPVHEYEVSRAILEALKCWTLAPGDVIRIGERS